MADYCSSWFCPFGLRTPPLADKREFLQGLIFWLFKGVPKAVQALLNGIEAVVVLTLENFEMASSVSSCGPVTYHSRGLEHHS